MTVIDSDGVVIGDISKVMVDTWSGEVRKYMVRQQAELNSYFFTPSQVGEVKDGQVKLKVPRADIDYA
jgi:sporulation protein YlmC with PRC-barrel domain